MSLTQLQCQSLICFVVKAVLFLISVVMEMLHCHTALEVSFCTEEEKNHPFCCFDILPHSAQTAFYFIIHELSDGQVLEIEWSEAKIELKT